MRHYKRKKNRFWNHRVFKDWAIIYTIMLMIVAGGLVLAVILAWLVLWGLQAWNS